MNIRSKLALVFGLGLAVNLGIGIYAIHVLKQATERAAQVHLHSSGIVSTGLTAQVHFKKQVQEWKDILLRGHEASLYGKHLKQFINEEKQTRSSIELLLTMLATNSNAERYARQFLRAHEELGIRYREALREFAPGTEGGIYRVDRAVLGIDRQPTDLLDRVVESVQKETIEELAAIGAQVTRIERENLALTILGMSGAILLLLWLVDKSVGKPIAAATDVAQRISEGRLDNPIAARGRDEAARLLGALDTMQRSLRDSQENLRRSEERTRLLLDSSGEGIYGMDMQGRCVFCNPAAMRLLGYTEVDKLIGSDIHALIHYKRADGTPFPSSECSAMTTLRHGREAHVDSEHFWRADGSGFPVEYRSHPICQDGEMIGAVVTFSDITRRRKNEQELREAHSALAHERARLAERVEERTQELHLVNLELARTARAKDEFLATMSHELRTPLTSILGISEMLVDQLYGPLEPQQTRVIETIHESGNHLLTLINDILDVVKVEAGKMELAWDLVSVAQLCEASLRLVKQSAKRKKLQVSARIAPEAGVLHCDARRMKQLLVNLLGNAVKFTPEGGAIGLEVAADPHKGQICFSVWDTGIGIPEALQQKLFQPFVQLDSQLTRRYSGTGLGLALVYRMAKLHGGRVSLESTVGKGSKFSVHLPWKQEQVFEDSVLDGVDPKPVDPVRGRPQLLLADDNQVNAEMLSRYLRNMGYAVTRVPDGVEVVAAALANPPDIVLMDIQLPNMDGLEATQRLRSHTHLQHIPIIALTALAMPGDRERCLEAGVSEYLSKPVGMKELHQVVQFWLERKQAADLPPDR